MREALKNKNFIICIFCCIGIICSLLLFNSSSTISNLSILNSSLNDEGVYEAPKGITFIEKIGLLYLTSGVCHQFGASKSAIELTFQDMLSIDFESLDNSSELMEDNSIFVGIEDFVVSDYVDENGEMITEEVNPKDYYTTKQYKTSEIKDSVVDEKDTIFSITTPIDFKASDIDYTSNVWQLNYRLYNDCLTGLEESYWGSQLFAMEEYFDRAWTSLKWICQDYLNVVPLEDKDTSYQAIVYSSNTDYYWLLTLNKLYDYNAFNDEENKANVIAMSVYPISTKEVSLIFEEMGILEE